MNIKYNLIVMWIFLEADQKLDRYYGGWADKIEGRTIDVGPSKLAYTLHQPVGVWYDHHILSRCI